MTDDSVKPGRPVRPTIRDVARLANVSIGTVSAVLNNSARPVAADTRAHVLRCIAELNFEPNNAARSLKHQRISSIGFIVPDLGNAFFADVAEGIQGVLDHLDCLLVLCMTWADTQREEYYAQVLRTQRLNGVIYLSGTGLPSPSLMRLAQQGAVVFVDECLPGIDAPFISAQNLLGARAMAQYVLGRGHRRLAVLGGPRGLWTSEQRLAGFREAFAAADIMPDSVPVLSGDYTEASGSRAADTIINLSATERPTAVLCANDLIAIGFIRRCRERGIAVPEHISVTGFDDIPAARLLSPALTTVRQPGNAMGRAAATLLLQRIGALPDAPCPSEFSTELRIRHSVGQGPSA
ncbi:LacI family DNA-binding transcriptional regulator [Sodalis sp. C49]|uniref:LacI family DNA-binding transcriptional regulator n=1 Tax=Sodalis sp. C49 TaxID=3228929 RepID=UPI003965AF48